MSRFGLFAAMLFAIDPSVAESARALAHKILAALAAHQMVELAVRNASSLPAAEAAAAREALEGELRPRMAAGGTPVVVTFSETPAEYLWVAEIPHEGRRDIVMLTPAREQATSRPASMPLVLEKRPLWEQDLPILDAVVREDGLIVLDPGGISTYDREGNRRQFVPISPAKPWPRDLRGRLEVQSETVRAMLPFVSPGPFYSEAFSGGFHVVAGLDGRAQLLDETGQAVASIPGWGSDLAAIETRCGNYVLATRDGDAGEPDAVQAFVLQDRQAVAASAPVEFLGPVTALWQSPGKDTAVAVARSLGTGRYAAFSLSLACGR